MHFNKTTAIITGGAAGFGRAFAKRTLQGGGRVFITDMNVEQLEITGKELAADFGEENIAWTHQNVVDSDSFHRVFEHAHKHFERPVNMLVNNAGIAGDMSFFNNDAPRAWESVVMIDLIALMRGTQVAIQQMKKHLGGKEGVIVNLASIAGLHPLTPIPEYSAAKHGVIGFTRSCYPLKQQANIRIVALAPGFTNTVMGQSALEHLPDETTAMGGLIEVDAVVDAFQLAVEDETNPGRIIRVLKNGHAYHDFADDQLLFPYAQS